MRGTNDVLWVDWAGSGNGGMLNCLSNGRWKAHNMRYDTNKVTMRTMCGYILHRQICGFPIFANDFNVLLHGGSFYVSSQSFDRVWSIPAYE